jgi:hypothetical protein
MMHPYAEGNVAAARVAATRCLEEIQKALAGKKPDAWEHVGIAMAFAARAKAQLDDAFALDEMAAGMDEEEG